MPAAFARIGGVLLTRQTVYGALDLATTLATDVIPATVGAGVSLWDQNGRRTTVAASDALVAQADEVQYSLGAGPCLSAWTTGQPVRVDDIPAETRWPEWAALAAKLGLRSALSVPLVAGGDTLGAIKVYAPTPGAYDAAAERLLTLFAGQAAVLLANMVSYEAAYRLSEQLKEALASRDVIGQAKGILMGQQNVDADTAFTILVAISQREHRKLREVAALMVAGAGRRRA